ncbi:MAG: pyridoxamine 5'-phosphate oxidase family protein [Gammaproteobacteria bacterium]|nr:pyridoxamine 5'-phosphate oxidase family protein [Gammaproteobacteria bacterium]
MGRTFDLIDEQMAAWIGAQRMFFVATAPLAADGLVNCSPKGLDTLRLLSPRSIAWLDLGGSGIETVAHLKENGRIVIMFCAFEGPPRILRLHGRGEVIERRHPEFDGLLARFPPAPVCRAIIRVQVTRIADSCGWGVPLYGYQRQRDDIARAVSGKDAEQLIAQAERQNSRSIDGLPGLDIEALRRGPAR